MILTELMMGKKKDLFYFIIYINILSFWGFFNFQRGKTGREIEWGDTSSWSFKNAFSQKEKTLWKGIVIGLSISASVLFLKYWNGAMKKLYPMLILFSLATTAVLIHRWTNSDEPLLLMIKMGFESTRAMLLEPLDAANREMYRIFLGITILGLGIFLVRILFSGACNSLQKIPSLKQPLALWRFISLYWFVLTIRIYLGFKAFSILSWGVRILVESNQDNFWMHFLESLQKTSDIVWKKEALFFFSLVFLLAFLNGGRQLLYSALLHFFLQRQNTQFFQEFQPTNFSKNLCYFQNQENNYWFSHPLVLQSFQKNSPSSLSLSPSSPSLSPSLPSPSLSPSSLSPSPSPANLDQNNVN